MSTLELDILIVLGFLALIIVLSILSDGLFTVDKSAKPHCKRHTWSVNPSTNKLQCIECPYEAGSYETEHGEY